MNGTVINFSVYKKQISDSTEPLHNGSLFVISANTPMELSQYPLLTIFLLLTLIKRCEYNSHEWESDSTVRKIVLCSAKVGRL